MKALVILQEQYKMLSKDIDGVWIDPEKIDEAIKELEYLQNENKSLVKTLEKYNEEMIELRKENQDLKNRSCVTCKYGHTYQFDEDIECMKLGADTQGLYFEKDFYCKNWELKNERD